MFYFIFFVYFIFLFLFSQTECDGKKLYCGTTALGAFVLGSQLTVFSIGDCQAVLCTNGKAVS